jgi:hypothetical protein
MLHLPDNVPIRVEKVIGALRGVILRLPYNDPGRRDLSEHIRKLEVLKAEGVEVLIKVGVTLVAVRNQTKFGASSQEPKPTLEQEKAAAAVTNDLLAKFTLRG